jgi:hypothetical protein
VNDTGQAFGPRGNGLSFGWNADNTANARDRHNPASPDALHDSFILMQKPPKHPASWQIAVPNGTYQVHLIAGDPNSVDGVYRMDVQGVLAINGRPRRSRRWVENTVVVRVTNNLLTLQNAPRARNNKIDAIDIAQVSTP